VFNGAAAIAGVHPVRSMNAELRPLDEAELCCGRHYRPLYYFSAEKLTIVLPFQRLFISSN